MKRILPVAYFLFVTFTGCNKELQIPGTHKYEPFGKYIVEIETIGSFKSATSINNREDSDKVTLFAEYKWARTSSEAAGAWVMRWWEWLLLAVVILLFAYRRGASHIPPTWWYISRRKRTAMRLALQAVARLGHEIAWSGCCIRGSDREKCFCLVQYPHNWALRGSPGYRMYAVWFATGQMDDMGDWVFHWGIFPSHAIATYEACRAEGRPWPNGFADWVRYWQ